MLTLSSIDWVITKSIGSNVTLVGTPAYHKKASDRRSLQPALNWISAGSIVNTLDFSPPGLCFPIQGPGWTQMVSGDNSATKSKFLC